VFELQDINYQKLSSKTLQIVIDVLSSIPTLALHEEPSDCLDAFKDFIYNLINSYNYQIDTEQKAQAVIALIALAISRGYAQHLLHVIDVLFQVHKRSVLSDTMKDSDHPLKVGHFLRQLAEYGQNKVLPLLSTLAYDSTSLSLSLSLSLLILFSSSFSFKFVASLTLTSSQKHILQLFCTPYSLNVGMWYIDSQLVQNQQMTTSLSSSIHSSSASASSNKKSASIVSFL
jgi:hypothetical protein